MSNTDQPVVTSADPASLAEVSALLAMANRNRLRDREIRQQTIQRILAAARREN